MAPESKYLHTLVAQISEEKDPGKSINYLAKAVLAMDEVNGTRHKTLDGKMDEMIKAITGNGDPESGLISRVCKNERWLKWIFGGLGFCGLGIGGWILDAILKGIN